MQTIKELEITILQNMDLLTIKDNKNNGEFWIKCQALQEIGIRLNLSIWLPQT